MDTTNSQESWNEKKNRLKQKFAVLMDDNLLFDEDRKEEVFDKLQIKFDKPADDMAKEKEHQQSSAN